MITAQPTTYLISSSFPQSSSETLSNEQIRHNEKPTEQQKEDHTTPPEAPSETLSTPPPIANTPPPNGGLLAWSICFSGFCLFFNTFGILNAFGVYQTYYSTHLLTTHSSSTISWIGSIQASSVLFIGFFSGPIYDRGYLRSLLIIGSTLVVLGHMFLSLSHTYWQVLLSQGFTIGVGAGCLFVPGLAILPSYFSTRLGLAVGLAAAGSSFGGIIYPIAFYKLISQIGFPWSVRVLGFIALATLIPPIAIMRMRAKPAKPRDLIDWSAFTDPSYMIFIVGSLIGFIGLYVFFFFLSLYAEEQGITSSAMAFYIVPIFNAASTFGRILPNALSDKTGPLNLITPGALACSVLIFAMLAVKSEPAIIIVAVLFGFFSGVFFALPPVAFVALTKDKSKIGTRIGMGFGMIAFGVLCGGPGGGAILGVDVPLDWRGLWVYGGVMLMVAGVIFCGLRVGRTGLVVMIKA